MTNQDMDFLAHKIVSLENKHNALARARQLPNSSVRLIDGSDVSMRDSVESGSDNRSAIEQLEGATTGIGSIADTGAENAVSVSDQFNELGIGVDVAWDSTQFATDLALQLDTELSAAKVELDQALVDSAAALAEAGLARGEAATAVSDAQAALAEAELAIKDVAGSVKGVNLAAESVTAEKILALTITAAHLSAGSVTALAIAADAVTAEKIAAGSVATDKLDALAVTAEKIAAGAIIADKIAANAITTAKLAADAIDGMTITGALIRTAASGQRMQLDINGLRAFDSGNLQRALLSASSGGLLLSGTLTSYTGGNTQRAVLSNGALTFDYVGSPGAGTMTLGPGGITSTDSDSRFRISKLSAAPGVGLDILAGTGGEHTASINMDGASGGKIRLNAATVEFQGDTDWEPLTGFGAGWSGFAGDGYLSIRARIRNGSVEIRGAAQKASFAAFETIVTMPAKFRPSSNTDGVCRHTASSVAAVQIWADGRVRVAAAGTTFVVVSGTWMLG